MNFLPQFDMIGSPVGIVQPDHFLNISADEQTRRRHLVTEADWSCRMEGLGTPTAERAALDERWIVGEISREEYETSVFAQARERIAAIAAAKRCLIPEKG